MDNITELVERVRKNDMLAMKVIYEKSVPAMMSLSVRITQDREESQDIIQESYLRSFQQIHTLDDPKKYFGWLKRIVLNNSLKASRSKMHFEEVEKVEAPEDLDESPWYQGIPFAKIKAGIDQLPNGCREIFTLYLLEEYKHREIAEELGIAVSTSKSQYRYALKLMKAYLTPFTKKN